MEAGYKPTVFRRRYLTVILRLGEALTLGIKVLSHLGVGNFGARFCPTPRQNMFCCSDPAVQPLDLRKLFSPLATDDQDFQQPHPPPFGFPMQRLPFLSVART